MKTRREFFECGRRRVATFVVTAVLAVFTATLALAGAGDLDATFDSDGRAVVDLGFVADEAFDAAIQADGKIVAVGISSATGFDGDFAVARINADGSPDTSFGGGDGVVVLALGFTQEARAVAIQPDGKIVVAGSSQTTVYSDFAVLRLNADGTLDASFGVAGMATMRFLSTGDEVATDVALQPDGKIVVVGTLRHAPGGPRLTVTRLNPNGTLDTGFGSGGLVVDVSLATEANAVALQADGKIVVAGTTFKSFDFLNDFDFILERYNSDGTLDTSFGEDGRVVADFFGYEDHAKAVVVQPDGKILVGGSADGGETFGALFTRLALARYNSDGTLDASFGSGGRVTTAFGDFALREAWGEDIALQDDGKIVAAGYVLSPVDGSPDFAAARYHPDGTPDDTFGVGGQVTTNFGTRTGDQARTVLIQADGKILLVGTSGDDSTAATGSDFAFVRYLADGGTVEGMHDVAVAGGGFRTRRHLDASRNGLGPFAVTVKVKNTGQFVENIFYAVSASEPLIFSSACAGSVLGVEARRAATVEGCTVTYAGPGEPILTLTVWHDDSDGGLDADPSNDSRSMAVVIKP